MSPTFQGPSKSDDLRITHIHSDSTIATNKVDINITNQTVTKCYTTPTTTVPSKNSITNYLTSTPQLHHETSTPVLSTRALTSSSSPSANAAQFRIPSRKHQGKHPCKLSIFLAACSLPTAPKSLSPASSPPRPKAPPYTGPNPYQKQKPDSRVNNAITQLDHYTPPSSQTSSSSSISTVSAHLHQNAVINTRTRTIQPPQRFGFPNPAAKLSVHSSTTSEQSSLCSPMASSENYPCSQNVSLQHVLLREIDEISTMTRSLRQMLEVTDGIISQLQLDSVQNSLVPAPLLEVIHTSVQESLSSAQSDIDDVITQPPEDTSKDTTDNESQVGLDNDSLGSFITVTTINSSTTSHTSTKNIMEIGLDPFVQLLDDIRYKREGDYRIILQNTNGIKEFRNSDPDYLPTMRALQQAGSDHM